MALGKLAVGALGAGRRGLRGTEQQLLETVRGLVVEQLIGLAEHRNRHADRLGRAAQLVQ